jgi:hypothetical protein
VHRRLVGLVAVVALVAGSCSNSTPTPNLTAVATQSLAAPATSAGPLSTPAAAGVQLTNTSYKATPPTKTGGTVTLAEWR